MNKIAILPLKEMPVSCDKCKIKTKNYNSFCGFYEWHCPFVNFRNKSHQEEYSDSYFDFSRRY